MTADRLGRRTAAACLALLVASDAAAAADGDAGFLVRVNGCINPYSVFGVYVPAGGSVHVELLPGGGTSRYAVQAPEGPLRPHRAGEWTWRAPGDAGLFPLVVRRAVDGASMTLNVFVLEPANAVLEGSLHGYTIGAYPARALGDQPIYRPPQGFIEVTTDNAATPVSPHFTLGQFLCKQDGSHPKYVVLQERLILFLEVVLREVNRHGWHCSTLHVMSGYRTPAYNAAIGNVPYSRHLWGGAADVFIDADPADGRMDDLNGDGVVDKGDADTLYDFIEGLLDRGGLDEFTGGLGSYGPTGAHGPFVHVDVRGQRARWGRE
jgi:hypothetical protein